MNTPSLVEHAIDNTGHFDSLAELHTYSSASRVLPEKTDGYFDRLFQAYHRSDADPERASPSGSDTLSLHDAREDFLVNHVVKWGRRTSNPPFIFGDVDGSDALLLTDVER